MSKTSPTMALPRENAALCYQCAKCSAGCPVAEHMEMLPHQVIHLAALGMEERVLGVNTLWMCAGCYTCATRCPNDINVTQVMDELRAKAVEQGVACPKPEVLTFHRTFLKDIARRDIILQKPSWLFEGHHIEHPKIDLLRGRDFAVTGSSEALVDADGETIGRLPLTVTTLKQALPVIG